MSDNPQVLPISAVLDEYPNIEELLDVHCPLIAILAEKDMTLSDILDLDIDRVIVFDKHNSDPVSLMVNNVEIGSGKTIKTGDHFGLHLRSYCHKSAVQAAAAIAASG